MAGISMSVVCICRSVVGISRSVAGICVSVVGICGSVVGICGSVVMVAEAVQLVEVVGVSGSRPGEVATAVEVAPRPVKLTGGWNTSREYLTK